LIEGCSALFPHRYLISGFRKVRVLTPDAVSDKAGMLPRLLPGFALVPKEIPGRDLPDQVEIVSLHDLQTPAIAGSSWLRHLPQADLLCLRFPISVPGMAIPRSAARALIDAIGRLSLTAINVRLFPASDIARNS
jgi:hypothetical protein